MSEMHLREPGFTYSAGDSRYIYKKKLDKACFQHDIVYEDYKDLPRKTASDKVLCDKAFKITKNPKYHVFQRSFPSMVYKFFDKKVKLCQPNNYTELVLEKLKDERYTHLVKEILGVLI